MLQASAKLKRTGGSQVCKKLSILCIFLVLCLNLNSQEKVDAMLKTGTFNAIQILSYSINGVEQNNFIDSINITISNNFYNIQVNFNHTSYNEYWKFKIGNLEKDGYQMQGELLEVSFEGMDEIAYMDEKSIGKIELNTENNRVMITIIFHIHNTENNYVIIIDKNRFEREI